MTIQNFLKQPFEPYTISRFCVGTILNYDLFSILEQLNQNYFQYSHEIDSYGIKHVMTRHSLDKTPITHGDFEKILLIIGSPDSISYVGLSNIKTHVIEYKKMIGGISYHYFEEIRTGRKTLSMKTFYKTKETL